MDELQLYEVNSMVKNIPYVDRNDRELQRYSIYLTAQVNSKRKLDLKDILSLPWDDEDKTKMPTEITNEEIERLKQRAKEMESKISN